MIDFFIFGEYSVRNKPGIQSLPYILWYRAAPEKMVKRFFIWLAKGAEVIFRYPNPF